MDGISWNNHDNASWEVLKVLVEQALASLHRQHPCDLDGGE